MNTSKPNDPALRLPLVKWGLLLIALGCVVIVLVRQSRIGPVVFDRLFTVLAWLQQVRAEHPAGAYTAAFLLYVSVTGLSLPGAAVMSMAYGWLFGFWRALLLVSVASTAGATVAFLMSRYLLRDLIQRRFGHRLAGFNAAFEREGAFYLLTLRLIPAVPFFVVNAGMGLTPISWRTFWWVSQLGMLPGTAVYVYAGTALPGLDELKNPSVTKILSPQLLVAFTLLGLFPLILSKLLSPFRRPAPDLPRQDEPRLP